MALVHKLLNEARTIFETKELKKTGTNAISGYSYFELSDFLPTIKQINKELGLTDICSFTEQYATLTLTAVEDDSQIVITTPFGAANLAGCHDIQNIGAVISYQRRYLLMIAYDICESDPLDSGAEAIRKNSGTSKGKALPPTASTASQPAPSSPTPVVAPAPTLQDSSDVTAFLKSVKNITSDQLPARAVSARENATETFSGTELEKVLKAIDDHENMLGWKERIAGIQVGEIARIASARDLANTSFKGEVLKEILEAISKREVEITAS